MSSETDSGELERGPWEELGAGMTAGEITKRVHEAVMEAGVPTGGYSDKLAELVTRYSSETGVGGGTSGGKAPSPEAETKEKKVTKRKVKLVDHQALFSDIFWKPKTIPDIPVPSFSPSDWHEEARLHIPVVDSNWVWNKKLVERFAVAMFEGDTTLLHGLHGTGKSGMVEQWCAALSIPFWRMNCNRETREQHFLGAPAIRYNEEGHMSIRQEATTLTDSLRYGGVFCEDEAFRHSAAMVLQALREKSNRTLIIPDAAERKLTAPTGKWWYVMTDNTRGEGDDSGLFESEVQDASTLDRIDAVIEVPYLTAAEEAKLVRKVHKGIPTELAKNMTQFAKEVRDSYSKKAMLNTFSIRPLLSWASKTELLGDVSFALKLAWYDKLGSDDQAVASDIYHRIFAERL